MNSREVIKEILYILIAIVLGVFAIKFMIWLLPIILLLVIAFMIYRRMRVRRYTEEIKREVYKNNNGKKMKVIHDLDDDD